MSKSLKDPSHIAKKRKFDHDLSHVKKFTSSVGHLLPVFYDLALPGDKYDFRSERFTQMCEMVSPAMTHITEHVDWFFVPIKQICSVANDNMFAIQDFHTTFLSKDMESTGNVIPMIDFAQVSRRIKENLVSTVITDYQSLIGWVSTVGVTDFRRVDEFGTPQLYNQARLSSLLGFSNTLLSTLGVPSDKVLLLSPLLACAYQKIWFDCFRITDRFDNDASFYNLDQFITAGVCGADSDEIQLCWNKFFTMRFRSWQRDFLTNTKISPLIDYNATGMQKRGENSDLSLANFNNYLSSQGVAPDSSVANPKSVVVNQGNTNTLNISSLRGAFAVEKLMEITRRAAKRYDAQVLAHFGYDVPRGISDQVYKIGSESNVIQINEVIASASSSYTDAAGNDITSTLGERGGKGSSYGAPKRKGFRFTAPCHGVIMALYSAEPTADYRSDMLDKLNTYRTREDWWQPEFDKLGMQPTYFYQMYFGRQMYTSNWYANIWGWTYRYQENKCQMNRVYGAFLYQYKHWTTQRSFDGLTSTNPAAIVNSRFFYIDPNFLNDIMLLSYKQSADELITEQNVYARDPMLHWFRFIVHKSSEMSNFSLPSL